MADDSVIGKRLGRYEIIDRVGRGGMAEVYKARQTSLDRFVAIKVLHPFLGEDPEFKNRFEREARNVAQLRHPNIVQVYDFDFDPQRELYYMVMEFIDGQTLRTRLLGLDASKKIMSIPEAIKITRDLAHALAYAHDRGMIHRDIKPANVIFDSDGRVVLTDFGIARIVTGPSMTTSGSMVGTPAYMAPEQGLGQSGDHRADIYSLGVLLYHLVTGDVPYQAETPIAIVLKHVNDPLPPPSERNPKIPEGLERVIYKSLAKSPENRYQNVREMAMHLGNLDIATTLILEVPPELRELREGSQTQDLRDSLAQQPEVAPRRTGCLGFVAAVFLAIIALGSGIYTAYNGLLDDVVPGFGGRAQALPPVTVILPDAPTPTADPTLAAVDIQQTIAALQTAQPTPTSTATPEPTAIVCTYSYLVNSQTPADGAQIEAGTTLDARVVITNTGSCAIPAGTQFDLISDEISGEEVELAADLMPDEAVELVLAITVPAGLGGPTPVEWMIELPDGTEVEPPLLLEIEITAPADG
ncbi:MAG: protein kinase [Chloroflexi bacterium]|nr:protein kinase [Chloroflexota bacterium]